nr:hypothetical protein GCM10020185_25540 [Pseudomonas brassicacearum subsp. brassicacearum]
MLIEQARLPAQMAEATNKLAASIAEKKLRNQKSAGGRAGIVQGLLQEFFPVVPGRCSTDVPG